MTQYIFRKLHLVTRRDIQTEFGNSQSSALLGHTESLVAHFHKSPYHLKVILRQGEIPTQLFDALAQRGITCLPAAPNRAHLFSDAARLRVFINIRRFASQDEETFAADLRRFLERQQCEEFLLETRPRPLPIAGRTLIMGVLNCTPDSFYDGGRYFSPDSAIAHGLRLAEAGADIIDIGGESTRPRGVYGAGAEPVPAEEEMRRVIPVIEVLSGKINVPISIDTYKAQVAEAAVHAGAGMVNDISGFQFDQRMPETVARLGVPVVLMHTKGTPAEMQMAPTYVNLMDELYLHLDKQIELARVAGIPENRFIIDPGLGFGKRLQDNYEILRRLPEFRGLGCPILVGPSRKSFVGKVLDLPSEQRLEGTAAAVASAVMNGAHIVRVHDVEAMRRVVAVADLIAGRGQ
jgi:dihydropteroate synthase